LNTALFCIVLMGKVCPLCTREQPKWAYKEAGGKGSAKKKKGKAAACNDCKAAGGDCVKLSAAGFILAGIPGDHTQDILNGIYSKTEQIVQSRHVYSGPNGMNAWYFKSGWHMADADSIGTNKCGAYVKSFAASPGSIRNDCVRKVFEIQENGLVNVPMPSITTTALTVEALTTATLAANNAFDFAIEQAAPSFVLSGLDSTHSKAKVMGVYQRQDEREKVNGRFVYKGPDDLWAWSVECGCKWSFGRGEDIGQGASFILVYSSAPTPESIVTKHWGVADENDKWQPTKLTTTAINYKPAALFKGTCTFCEQCREWRRCGQDSCCSNAMYCSEACQ